MPRFGPISRNDLIACLRGIRLYLSGFRSGHPYMTNGQIKLTIPNPHRGDIGRRLLGTSYDRRASAGRNGRICRRDLITCLCLPDSIGCNSISPYHSRLPREGGELSFGDGFPPSGNDGLRDGNDGCVSHWTGGSCRERQDSNHVPGRVGCYVGAFFVRDGEDVTFIDMWPEHVETMRSKGLRASGSQGDFTVPVNALHLTDAQNIHEQFDYAFITVKSYDTEWATHFIKRYVKPDGFFISLQNCWNDPLIGEIVGPERAIGSVASHIEVALWEPGHVLRAAPSAATTATRCSGSASTTGG